jgi:hypothetical protein
VRIATTRLGNGGRHNQGKAYWMSRWLHTLTLLALVLAGGAPPLAAQSALTRTPNLTGGWVGLPWGGQFDLLQRFFDPQGALAGGSCCTHCPAESRSPW